MQVIKERKPFETWAIQADCNGLNWNQDDKIPCGSTLKVEKEDILKRSWFKYPDYEGTNYGFICPVCGCFTEFNEKDLPDGIKLLAKEYK